MHPSGRRRSRCTGCDEIQNDLQQAIQTCRLQLLQNPADPIFWIRLGQLLLELGANQASVGCFKRALEIEPDNSGALSGAGIALLALDREDEAIQRHAKAAKLAPNNLTILANYAVGLRGCNRQEEAIGVFDRALQLEPENPVIGWERVLALLDLGRFEEGWNNYELRWKQPGINGRKFAAPRWTGQDLVGKTVFVYEEQGFGDTILFSRFLPQVKARGARVVFEARPELQRLFASVPGVDLLVPPGGHQAPFDFECPIMSLPACLGTTLETIPPPAVLAPPPPLGPEISRLLDLGAGRFKVGIVWSGSILFARNHRRAVTPDRFLPFAEVSGVQLYSLQKGPLEAQLGACAGRSLVLELGPLLNDFATTAAVLRDLDLVIMTDTAVAHLAGSLGLPVWNLLNYRPGWIYLRDRNDTPWYPSMRLFRQPKLGDWDSVFESAIQALQREVNGAY
jgi:cytochrome c-type biogenesis protein CcmH/NrfG